MKPEDVNFKLLRGAITNSRFDSRKITRIHFTCSLCNIDKPAKEQAKWNNLKVCKECRNKKVNRSLA